ncbi:hypothetical protein [Nocardioides sp. PD653]|nr:hypothetical protein [Nocardioides sp. PD653]GAW57323.1 hypothetical protein PD653_4767 [Nocardioides sp. PD653]
MIAMTVIALATGVLLTVAIGGNAQLAAENRRLWRTVARLSSHPSERAS